MSVIIVIVMEQSESDWLDWGDSYSVGLSAT